MHKYAFKTELYKEHIEEAGFRYEIRTQWLDDPKVSWIELEEYEFLIDAHLDALVIGAEHALKVALEHIPEAEPGELFIIVRLFCKHQLIDRLARMWSDFDFDDHAKTQAVADALKWNCPSQWQAKLAKVFETDNQKMYPIVVPCVASYSPTLGPLLLSALPQADSKHHGSLLDGLAKMASNQRLGEYIRGGKSDVILEIFNQSDDAITRAKSLRCLLLFKEPSILSRAASCINSHPILFAIAGDRSQRAGLVKLLDKKSDITEERIIAIGLAGDLSGVAVLLGILKNSKWAKVAAEALHLISGAPLYEDVHVVDNVDEDELFEHERQAFHQGSAPKNVDGQAFGTEISELSVDHTQWFSWFTNNKSLFDKQHRYRYGRIITPIELVNCIIHPATARKYRDLAYDELLMRYSIKTAFDTADSVYKQKTQLNTLHQTVSLES